MAQNVKVYKKNRDTGEIYDLETVEDLTQVFAGNSASDICYLERLPHDVELPELKNGTQTFKNSNIEIFACDLNALENGSGMFENTKIDDFRPEQMPKLKNGNRMFYGCSKLDGFVCEMPELTTAVSMFAKYHYDYKGVRTFKSYCPKLKNIDHMFWVVDNFESYDAYSPLLENMNEAFEWCHALTLFNPGVSSLEYLTTANHAFSECRKIMEFHIALPALKSGWQTFTQCHNLTLFNTDTTVANDLASLEASKEGGVVVPNGMFSNCRLDIHSAKHVLNSLSSRPPEAKITLGCLAYDRVQTETGRLCEGCLLPDKKVKYDFIEALRHAQANYWNMDAEFETGTYRDIIFYNNIGPSSEVKPSGEETYDEYRIRTAGKYGVLMKIKTTTAGETVSYGAEGVDLSKVMIFWEYQDGNLGPDCKDNTHTYAEPGEHWVLVLSDDNLQFPVNSNGIHGNLSEIHKFNDKICLLAYDAVDAFRYSAIEYISPEAAPELFDDNVTDFSRCFYYCPNLNYIPQTIFSSGSTPTSFEECFNGCTALDCDIPALWTRYPNADGTNCFSGCYNGNNYDEVPYEWGGKRYAVLLTLETENVNELVTYTSEAAALGNIILYWDYETGDIGPASIDSLSNVYSQPGIHKLLILSDDDLYFPKRADGTEPFNDILNHLTGIDKDKDKPFVLFEDTGERAFYNADKLEYISDAAASEIFSDDITDFSEAFYGCKNLISIPDDLFKDKDNVTTFKDCFNGCESLETIPALWERYDSVIPDDCFKDCYNADNYWEVPIPWGGPEPYYGVLFKLNIPANGTVVSYGDDPVDFKDAQLFWDYNPATDRLNNPGHSITHTYSAGVHYLLVLGIDDLPSLTDGVNIKNYITEIHTYKDLDCELNFQGVFSNCPIQTIDPDVVLFGPDRTDFSECFKGCSSFASIPENLFTNNEATSGITFESCFEDCTALTAIPSNLFDIFDPASVESFENCFNGCSSITTRVPELWNIFTDSTGTGCFSGCINTKNYWDIPYEWGGPQLAFRYGVKLKIRTTRANQTVYYNTTSQSYNWNSFKIFWEYNNETGELGPSEDCIYHSFATPGEHYIVVFGETTLYFPAGGRSYIQEVLTGIYKYQNKIGRLFGVSNITSSASLRGFQNNTTLEYIDPAVAPDIFAHDGSDTINNFSYVFSGCTALTNIPAGLFENRVGLKFIETFSNCTGIRNVNVPELWETFPNADGTDCFKNCINAKNYEDIPYEWGGPEQFAVLLTLYTMGTTIVNYNPEYTDSTFDFEKTKIYWNYNPDTDERGPVATSLSCTCETGFRHVLVTSGTDLKFPTRGAGIVPHLYKIEHYKNRHCKLLNDGKQAFKDAQYLEIIDDTIAPEIFDKDVEDFSECFYGCGRLDHIPAGIFTGCSKATNFEKCFYMARVIGIPAGLFSDCTAAENFKHCFAYTENSLYYNINTNIFEACENAIDFSYCFFGSTLRRIENGCEPFKNCRNATLFTGCFGFSQGLEYIPSNLFHDCASATDFSGCFNKCDSENFNEISFNLFRYCSKAETFEQCFAGCSWLRSIGSSAGSGTEHLFTRNIHAQSFRQCFSDCVRLQYVPVDLFRYCTEAEDFAGCFYNCIGISGGITGTQPYLWEQFSTLDETHTRNCFYGCINLPNFPAVPKTWGGMVYGALLTLNVPADAEARITYTDESYYQSNLLFYWNYSDYTNPGPRSTGESAHTVTTSEYGRGTHQLLVVSYTDLLFDSTDKHSGSSTLHKTFRRDYLTKIDKFGDKECLLIKNELSDDEARAGIGYFSQSKLKEITSAAAPEIFSKSLTRFQYCFYQCFDLKSIPENIFSGCTEAKNFYGVFYRSGLTGEIPTNLFKDCTHVTRFAYAFAETLVTYTADERSARHKYLFNSDQDVDFFRCFQNCQNLEISEGVLEGPALFNCPNVTAMEYVFDGCTSLGRVSWYLFANCPKIKSFSHCFINSSIRLVLNLGIFTFCPEATDFSYCFANRTSGGSIDDVFSHCNPTDLTGCFRNNINCTGDAPTLWTRYPNATGRQCFAGNTQLSNWNSIPYEWKY